MRHGAAVLASLVLALSCAAPVHASPSPPREDPWPPLVDVAWLQQRLATSGLTVLDARDSLREFLGEHVPGAQFLAVENLRSSSEGVPARIHPPAVFAEIAARAGLRPDSRVVVYGKENDPDASFVAAVLQVNGIARVAVLDGGFARWTAQGAAVSKNRPRVARGAGPYRAERGALASYDDVRKALGDGRTLLLDVRAAEQFRAGHIPGAVHRFWGEDVAPASADGSGLFRGDAELRSIYEALGVRPGRPVIVYCNSGHMASVTFRTLRYRLGLTDVRLYEGSWVEWSTSPGAPVETAAAGAGGAAQREAQVARARAAADALTGELSRRLMAELREGGAPKAVAVCAQVAPEIAAAHSREGLSVRRVSLKTRNPANGPDGWERTRLEQLEARHRAGDLPAEVVDEDVVDGRSVLRYMRPIRVMSPCLACHGVRESLNAEVAGALAGRYPRDAATGYAAGDLRGAVSVIVQAP